MTLATAGSRRSRLTMLTLPDFKRLLLALVLIAPAIATAVLILALESYRTIEPGSIVFTEPPASSLTDALVHREVELAYAFIRDGIDPNAMLTVQDATLTGGQRVEVSPLMLAVAARNRNAVMMLLSAGVQVDLPANRLSPCLAHDLGENDLKAMIVRQSRASVRLSCGQPASGRQPPLLRYLPSN